LVLDKRPWMLEAEGLRGILGIVERVQNCAYIDSQHILAAFQTKPISTA
jgi:hypothetical protein